MVQPHHRLKDIIPVPQHLSSQDSDRAPPTEQTKPINSITKGIMIILGFDQHVFMDLISPCQLLFCSYLSLLPTVGHPVIALVVIFAYCIYCVGLDVYSTMHVHSCMVMYSTCTYIFQHVDTIYESI